MTTDIVNGPQKRRYYNKFHSILNANDFEQSILDQFDSDDTWLPEPVQKVIKKHCLSADEWEQYFQWLSIQHEKRNK